MLHLYFFKRRPEEQQGSTLGVSFKEVFVKKGGGGVASDILRRKIRKKRISLCLFEETYQCLEGLERFLVRYAFYQAVGNKRHK